MRRWFLTKRSLTGGSYGFSAGELLVVVAIVGLIVAIAIPLVSEQIRQAKIRAAADNYAMALKAVRMIAVSKRSQQSMTILVDPANQYSYADTHGAVREITLPDGVRIKSSTNPITFELNGSLAAQATTVLEADLSNGVKETWTVTTSILGMPKVTHARQ